MVINNICINNNNLNNVAGANRAVRGGERAQVQGAPLRLLEPRHQGAVPEAQGLSGQVPRW